MKKFLIILYIIIFVALAYYVVTLFITRDFNKEASNNTPPKTETTSKTNVSAVDTSITEDNSSETSKNETTDIPTKTAKYDITRTDCNNNCTIITNKDEKEYCLQACGLSSSNSKSCEDLIGLKKDYCLRDKAITQNKIDKCQKIQDGGIEKQCINRISENLIDDIMK